MKETFRGTHMAQEREIENGEFGTITICTNYITIPKSFKKLKLQRLGGWDTYLEQINCTSEENKHSYIQRVEGR